ncbi:MAG: hypothetical protein J0I18_12330 [Actinobacteria bacterium]|nr:hypothetical protein [Actinomycetota bacterium]
MCYRPSRGDAIDFIPNCQGDIDKPTTKGINKIGAWGAKTLMKQHILDSASAAQFSVDREAGQRGWKPKPPEEPKPKPADPSVPSTEGTCGAGYSLVTSSYINGQCVGDKIIKEKQEREDAFFDGVGVVGAIAGLVELGFPPAAVVAYAAGGLATAYDCSNGPRRSSQCMMDGLGLMVPAAGGLGKLVFAAKVGEVIEDGTWAIGTALNIVGIGEPLKKYLRGLSDGR